MSCSRPCKTGKMTRAESSLVEDLPRMSILTMTVVHMIKSCKTSKQYLKFLRRCLGKNKRRLKIKMMMNTRAHPTKETMMTMTMSWSWVMLKITKTWDSLGQIRHHWTLLKMRWGSSMMMTWRTWQRLSAEMEASNSLKSLQISTWWSRQPLWQWEGKVMLWLEVNRLKLSNQIDRLAPNREEGSASRELLLRPCRRSLSALRSILSGRKVTLGTDR